MSEGKMVSGDPLPAMFGEFVLSLRHIHLRLCLSEQLSVLF